MQEFLIATSSMPPENFQEALRRAEVHLAAGIRLAVSDANSLALSNWHWPEATQVQAQELLFAAEEARDKLLLPDVEPAWSVYDALFAAAKNARSAPATVACSRRGTTGGEGI